jgi:uroporphyrinogen-III synthase
VVAPLLTVRPLPEARIDLAGVAALAFTSPNGVAAFAALSPERGLPVYAVGEATAAAARAAGFPQTIAGDADATALAQLIVARGQGLKGPVLHLAPREPAADLAGLLTNAGVPARSVAVYETLAAERLPAPAEKALAAGRLEAVLVHSPKAGRTLARLLAPAEAARLAAFALSPACAEPLAALPFARVLVAEAPNEAALLALLDG